MWQRRSRGLEHGHGEPHAAGTTGQQARYSQRTREATSKHRGAEQDWTRKHKQDQPHDERIRSLGSEGGARCLEQVAIRHAGRTCRLTCPAAEAAVDVRSNVRIPCGQRAVHQRTHEVEPAARAVVLVLQHQVGWTGLQAEAAVHARIEARARVGKRRSWNGARCGDSSAVAHASPRMPGLRIRPGSNADRTREESASVDRMRCTALHSGALIRSPTTVTSCDRADSCPHR